MRDEEIISKCEWYGDKFGECICDEDGRLCKEKPYCSVKVKIKNLKLAKFEKRIAELEKENKKLREKLNNIEEAYNLLCKCF